MTLAQAPDIEPQAAAGLGQVSERRRLLTDEWAVSVGGGATGLEPNSHSSSGRIDPYRWLPPSKCLEAMEVFPRLRGQTRKSLQELLFQAVSRGDIRGMLYEVVVPKAHIGVYLTMYLHCTNQSSNIVPSDLALSYDDLCRLFDRPPIGNQERRRTFEEHSGSPKERTLASERRRIMPDDASVRPIIAAQAARTLLSARSVPSAGNFENWAKRALRRFLEYFSMSSATSRPDFSGRCNSPTDR